MTIAVVVEFPGATAEQYDLVIAKLGLTAGGAAMPGQLSHWVSVTDAGTRITDVWESRETFEKFAEEKMVPTVTEVGRSRTPKNGVLRCLQLFHRRAQDRVAMGD